MRNIVAGREGKQKNNGWHVRVWATLKALCTKPDILDLIVQYENRGSDKLAKKLFGTLTILFLLFEY